MIGLVLLYMLGIPVLFFFLLRGPQLAPPRLKDGQTSSAYGSCAHSDSAADAHGIAADRVGHVSMTPVQRRRCGRTSCVEGVEILLHLRLRYKPGLYQYWEATVIPAWKAALVCLLLYTSGGMQIALLAVLLLAKLAVYHFFPPYVLALNNREERWLHAGALLVLLGGVLFYFASPGDTTGKKVLEVFSFLLVAATLCVMVLLIGWVLWSVVREYRAEMAAAAAQGLAAPSDLEHDDAIGDVQLVTAAAEAEEAEHGLAAAGEPPERVEMLHSVPTHPHSEQLQESLLGEHADFEYTHIPAVSQPIA